MHPPKRPEPAALHAARKGLVKPYWLCGISINLATVNQCPDTKNRAEKSFSQLSAACTNCLLQRASYLSRTASPAGLWSGSHELLRFDTSHLAKGVAFLHCCRINSAPDQPVLSRAVTNCRALQPMLSSHRSPRAACTHVAVHQYLLL